jgi:riboflavin biosynthesis pyrimidine reductase
MPDRKVVLKMVMSLDGFVTSPDGTHEWMFEWFGDETRLGLVDEYQLTTVPIAIGAGRSPFAELTEHVKFNVVEQERFRSGALAQILVPQR